MLYRLRISLVIPAYNEESYLEACLRSAVAQRLPFYEIIVVDNNSTDDTAALVAQFPGVKLLRETRQGVVHARNRGFNAAQGEIIARIDADTRLPADWTLHVQRAFANRSVAAVTGKVSYYDTACARLLSASDNLVRRSVALLLGKNMALQGANMAMRREVWQEICTDMCAHSGIHEDFDLAIHAAQRNFAVRYVSSLRAQVAFRQAASSWANFASYYWHCPGTYRRHDIRRGYWLVPVSVGMIIAYPLLHLLSKGYDAQTQRFSVARALTASPVIRVNPATYVD